MNVRDLMTPEPITVAPETPVAQVIALLVSQGVNGVPVVDASGAVLGMVTSGDLIHRLADERLEPHSSLWRESFYRSVFSAAHRDAPDPAEGATAAQVMSRDTVCVAPEDDMVVAARLLIAHGVKSLPVLEAGRLVGMISRMDLLRCLHAHPDCCNPLKKTD